LPDAGNTFGTWQQGFRVGWLDLVMLGYALETVGALDMPAVTCLDRLAELPGLQVCRRYRHGQDILARLTRSPAPCSLAYQEQLTRKLADCRPILEPVANVSALLDVIEGLGVPIGIMSTGPRAADKHCLRHDAQRRYRAPRRATEGQSLQPLTA
jgi:adenylosuccinate synthase